jgi:hypothetical protein
MRSRVDAAPGADRLPFEAIPLAGFLVTLYGRTPEVRVRLSRPEWTPTTEEYWAKLQQEYLKFIWCKLTNACIASHLSQLIIEA